MKTVIILDDQQSSIERVKSILEQNFTDLQIQVASFDNIEAKILDLVPDIIFVDPLFPDPHEAMRLFMFCRNVMPDCRTILHSKATHRKFDLLQYLREGANAYISKLASKKDYLRAFLSVSGGEIYLPDIVRRDLTFALWEDFAHQSNTHKYSSLLFRASRRKNTAARIIGFKR
ncbi:response regulator transcription factor [Dyadobacter jiangsuensis]|uniref:Response regulator receiver domain-containing protein n=1 Tax=Dyadobacter jiangsuensis TaxID=1591085 RepID=A0A2P8FAR0_9BACT|nr:response regulator transcription factor [Dyadobacter jiangsuensis]PSL18813.1 response regulator receiver domain-containing protein [Dyadobacter jiangsuensis]